MDITFYSENIIKRNTKSTWWAGIHEQQLSKLFLTMTYFLFGYLLTSSHSLIACSTSPSLHRFVSSFLHNSSIWFAWFSPCEEKKKNANLLPPTHAHIMNVCTWSSSYIRLDFNEFIRRQVFVITPSTLLHYLVNPCSQRSYSFVFFYLQYFSPLFLHVQQSVCHARLAVLSGRKMSQFKASWERQRLVALHASRLNCLPGRAKMLHVAAKRGNTDTRNCSPV